MLQSVILAYGSFPSFIAKPDEQGDGGAYDLARMGRNTPPGDLQTSLVRDNFLAAYKRNWTRQPAAFGDIQLIAFADDSGATDFQRRVVAYFAAHGVTGVASSAVPGATEFTEHGTGVSAYTVVAERHGVVAQVTSGGEGIDMAFVEQLANQQLDKL